METSYTSDINFSNQEIEHTGLLENGFMPVETAQELSGSNFTTQD